MKNPLVLLFGGLFGIVAIMGLILWLLMGNVISNIAYGSDERQQLDIYPVNDCPPAGCTVVIFVHGGGWNSGSKNDVYRSGVGEALASQHFVVVAPGYRLGPVNKFPAQPEDVAAAFNWVKKNIGQYGGNPAKIYLIGHSAGAHLVSLVATNPFYLQRYGYEPQKDIAGVISLDTDALDLLKRLRVLGDDDKARVDTFPRGSEQSASPFWNISEGRTYPPFLLVAASNAQESIAQAGAMGAKLTAASSAVEVAVMPYEGVTDSHTRILQDIAGSDTPVAKKVVGFITAP